MSAVVGATHVLCSIGSGTDQVWASVRTGVGRINNSHVIDRHREPIQMGLVPEAGLGTLAKEIEGLPLPSRVRRMLRLAAPSFRAVAHDAQRPAAVFLGLPEFADADAPWLKHIPGYLQMLTGIGIDGSRSAIFPRGRASGLLALERALAALDKDPATPVIVGGADSYLDPTVLGRLDAEQRILGSQVMDGFIPGEGAAFVVLSSSSDTGTDAKGTRVIVKAAASVMDPGHRYGDAPARGEGLATALSQLRQRTGQLQSPVGTTFAGINGESFDARLWGVARVRHSDFFSPAMTLEHPADKFGDAGAATGAILVALAARALATQTRSGPALVWAASDREPRACALLSVAKG